MTNVFLMFIFFYISFQVFYSSCYQLTQSVHIRMKLRKSDVLITDSN